MSPRATGTFDVTLVPQPSDDILGRRSIDKVFHGDLDAISQGQMLAIGTAVAGSAAYVAIERVTGSLGGRRGTFALHHTGTMRRGEGTLAIAVVPDSGTDELAGLDGTMTIEIVDGEHRYAFDYSSS